MEKKLIRYGIFLWLLFAVYNIISYLIFLRDDFLLERIAFLTGEPELLETGRRLGKVLYVNSLPTPLFLLIVTAMFVVYARALRLVGLMLRENQQNNQTATSIVLRSAAAFLAITFFSFPALSTDVFDYIASNRVLYVHQENPWLVAPDAFPQDEFMWLGSWKFRASVYGPVQFLFSSLVHLIARDSVIGNILGFKLTASIFTMAAVFVMSKWLKKHYPRRLLYSLTAFCWNPLLFIEIIGNAHNDMIMTFFILLGFWLLMKKRIVLSALGVSLSMLAKVAAGLYVPLMTVWLTGNKALVRAGKFSLVFALFTLAGFATLGKGMLGFTRNLGVQLGLYLRSLPTIIRFLFLQSGFPENKALLAEKFLTIPPFVAIYMIVMRKLKIIGILPSLVIVMLAYFILVSPMLQPWYLIWVLPFVALLPPGRLQAGALVFTWSSLLYYVVLFVSYYFSPLRFVWQIVMYLTMVLPPLLVWAIPQTWYTHLGVRSPSTSLRINKE